MFTWLFEDWFSDKISNQVVRMSLRRSGPHISPKVKQNLMITKTRYHSYFLQELSVVLAKFCRQSMKSFSILLLALSLSPWFIYALRELSCIPPAFRRPMVEQAIFLLCTDSVFHKSVCEGLFEEWSPYQVVWLKR